MMVKENLLSEAQIPYPVYPVPILLISITLLLKKFDPILPVNPVKKPKVESVISVSQCFKLAYEKLFL